MACSPITSWQIDGETVEDFIFGGSKINADGDCSHEIKRRLLLEIYWHTECSIFTASSFRIWNSSTGILSPPLALFVVMLPKTHLILHSRISGSRWVTTPSWLSGSWRSFLYSSSLYSCLENPRDRGDWWAAVYGVKQSWTWLKWLSSSNSDVK